MVCCVFQATNLVNNNGQRKSAKIFIISFFSVLQNKWFHLFLFLILQPTLLYMVCCVFQATNLVNNYKPRKSARTFASRQKASNKLYTVLANRYFLNFFSNFISLIESSIFLFSNSFILKGPSLSFFFAFCLIIQYSVFFSF